MRVTIIRGTEVLKKMPWMFRGDIGQTLQFEILTDSGEPYNLTSKTVTLKTEQINSGLLKTNDACTIVSAVDGIATYTLQADDLDVAGVFDTELAITSTGFSDTADLGRFTVMEDLPR